MYDYMVVGTKGEFKGGLPEWDVLGATQTPVASS